MSKNISVGIDIGTYQIKVVVGEFNKKQGDKQPKIIGTGFAKSKGLRYGYIVNSGDVTRSLKRALEQAEKASGISIKKAYVSLGGVSLESIVGKGSTIISRADNEITDLDVQKALEASEEHLPKQAVINRKILHTIPLEYKLDGREILGRPVGMKGVKLEVEALFITYLEQHLNDIIHAIEDAGVQVIDVIAAPLAASLATLTKAQKIAGCVLANIGSETVSVVVYENNIPLSLAVFPIGSTDLTNDIALGLKVPIDEAEQIKLGGITGAPFPQKKLEEIIIARISAIFNLIESHLKEKGKSALLPAGIIITGGGSSIATIEDLAKATLRLPSKISHIHFPGSTQTKVKDASWSVAYGLCILGLTGDDESTGIMMAKQAKTSIMTWLKQFLP